MLFFCLWQNLEKILCKLGAKYPVAQMSMNHFVLLLHIFISVFSCVRFTLWYIVQTKMVVLSSNVVYKLHENNLRL